MHFKKFLNRFQFEYLAAVLRETFTRFPLSVICCAAGAVLSMLEVHDLKPLSDDNTARVFLFLSNGVLFFTAARLYAEGAKATRVRQAAITVAGGAALLALAFLPDHFTAMHVFIGAALSLSMLFAPYIGRNSTEDSIWYCNYLNGISLAVAGLSTLILCLGVSAIIGSMDYLLYDMKLSGKIYGDIWVFGAAFFGPVMFMHQLSKQFDFDRSECVLLPGIYFIANFLVVPLILIYSWVLYAYLLKIVVQLELPKGNLAYMVTGFGSLGMAARLAVFPMRQTGTKLLQQFYKFFYFILVVPILLLAIGLYTRLSQYGVTEDRYAIGICLAWLTALTVWNIAWRNKAHIKQVPMLLACLFVFGAIGPWGAVSISVHSQAARLESLLMKAGVAHTDGTVTKVSADAPFELRKDISGILDYMFDGHEKAVEPFVAPFRAEIEKKYKADGTAGPSARCGGRSLVRCWEMYDMPRHVMEAWGMQYVSRWESVDNNYVTIRTEGQYWNDDSIQKIAPYAYMMRLSPSVYGADWTTERTYREDGQEKFKVKLAFDRNGVFSATLADGRSASFPLQDLAAALYKEKMTVVSDSALSRMILHDNNGSLTAELRVADLRGRATDGQLKLEGATLVLLFAP